MIVIDTAPPRRAGLWYVPIIIQHAEVKNVLPLENYIIFFNLKRASMMYITV